MRVVVEHSLRQAVALNIVFVGSIIVAALLVLPDTSVERYPNFNFGEVNITTYYPGASAQEVERLVSRKLEDALKGMKDLEYVRTTSAASRSEVHVKFVDDTDYGSLYDELRFRILGAQNLLPVQNGEGLQPGISLIETDEWLPVVQVNVISRDEDRPRSDRAITLIAEELENILEGLPGVKDVVLIGEERRQVTIDIDPDELLGHRISLSEVEQALRGSWASQPAGDATTPEGLLSLRVDSRHRSVEDLMATVVRNEGGGRALRLSELIIPGGVRVESQDSQTVSRVNGRKSVGCKVLKYETADAREVVESVRLTSQRFLASHAEERIDLVYSLDSTVIIKDSLGVLRSSLILGVALVSLVLWLFVGWRNAALTVAGIPFAFLGSIVVMHFLGYSLNELSLLAFVLVSGVIVDDAVVVLENIHRHREAGRPLHDAVVTGTAEVFWPIVNSTLTTIAAFLPLLIMSGIVGEFFSIIPKAVAIALAISLVECMIILPVHVLELEHLFGRARISRVGESVEEKKKAGGLFGLMTHAYDWVLNFNLRHHLVCLGIVLIMFTAAIGVIWQSFTAPERGARPILRIQFFPDETNVLMVIVRVPGSATLARTDDVLSRLSRDLVDLGPGVISNVTAIAGLYVDKAYKPVFAEQYGFLQIELPANEDRDFEEVMRRLERELASVAGEDAMSVATELVQRSDELRQLTGAYDDTRKKARSKRVALEVRARELAAEQREIEARQIFLQEHAHTASMERELEAVRSRAAEIRSERQELEAKLEREVLVAREALDLVEQQQRPALDEQARRLSALEAELVEVTGDDELRARISREFAGYEQDVAAKRDREDPIRLLSLLRIDVERRYEVGGIELEISAQRGGPPTGADINVRVTGIDEEEVYRATDALLSWMHEESGKEGKLPGVTNLSDDRGPIRQVLSFKVDEARASEHGLRVQEVVTFVAGAFEGSYVGEFRASDEDLPMRMRIAGASAAPEALLSQVITEGDGDRRVLVSDVSGIEMHTEHAFLNRWGFRRSVIVQGDLEDSSPLNPRAVAALVRSWFDEHGDQFSGVNIGFGGTAESTARSYQSMTEAFIIAVIAIYFILAGQFKSYLQPFIILSNVFFAFIGVVLMMAGVGMLVWLRLAQPERALITVQGFIAIVGLTGVVVNDSIVLIDFINRLRAGGMELRPAIVQACHWRMRPIMMTTLTTIAGLAPMAIGIPRFSIAWSPMATCFAAGLAMATTLTLLVMPVLYEMVAHIPVRAELPKDA